MFLLEKRFQVYKVLNMYEMLDILVLWIWWVDGQSRTIMKTFLFEEHLRNRGANIQWRHYLAINIISYLEDTHNSPLGRRRSVPWGFSNADHILVNKSFEVFHKSVYRRTACLSRVDIWISRKCANIKESSIRRRGVNIWYLILVSPHRRCFKIQNVRGWMGICVSISQCSLWKLYGVHGVQESPQQASKKVYWTGLMTTIKALRI